VICSIFQIIKEISLSSLCAHVPNDVMATWFSWNEWKTSLHIVGNFKRYSLQNIYIYIWQQIQPKPPPPQYTKKVKLEWNYWEKQEEERRNDA
jgi:hypothetical protein